MTLLLLVKLLQPVPSLIILCLLFLAILFLQSGLDKVFNYSGNYEWLKGHFAKSPLKNTIGILMPVITLLEVAAGVCCAIGMVMYLLNGATSIGLLGTQLSAISILSLFFGQRLAQDYEGAGNLTGYFIISMVGIFLFHLV